MASPSCGTGPFDYAADSFGMQQRMTVKEKNMELTNRVIRAREEEEKLYEELHENPVDLDEVFQTFVNTVHYNYVGFEQKRLYFTPAEYHTYVYSRYRFNSLTMEMLVRSLHQFIGDMHDRHLTFHCEDWVDYKNLAMKYRVRAYEDRLYVTEADPETGLTPGDQILEVQHMTPDRVRKYTRNNCFYSRIPEREGWLPADGSVAEGTA
jgi:hypothetical protein